MPHRLRPTTNTDDSSDFRRRQFLQMTEHEHFAIHIRQFAERGSGAVLDALSSQTSTRATRRAM